MTGVVVPIAMAFASIAAPHGRGFTSFKCTTAIEYTRRCSRDALIQASLEPDIVAIEPLHVSNVGPADTYFSFAVVTQGRRCAIALTENTSGTAFAPPDRCDAIIAINRASILADPIKTAARTIWSHRDAYVPPLFSVRLMRRLKSDPGGARLGDLEDDLIDEPKNWIGYTLALACGGLVFVDYRAAISDDTLVRINPNWQSRTLEHWLD